MKTKTFLLILGIILVLILVSCKTVEIIQEPVEITEIQPEAQEEQPEEMKSVFEMCKLVQIMVEGGERFQITFKESPAVEFPEAAEFFQKGFAVGRVLPAVGNGEVDEFLHPLEGFFRIVATAFGEPFGGAVGLT